MVLQEPRRLLQYWELDDSPLWRSGLMPDSRAYWRSVRHVRARLDVSAPARYLSTAAAPSPADAHNNALALSGKLGALEPISCLEAALFAHQAGRRPMETEPTEFLAFVLRRGKRLKVWYYTVDQPGIGGSARCASAPRRTRPPAGGPSRTSTITTSSSTGSLPSPRCPGPAPWTCSS